MSSAYILFHSTHHALWAHQVIEDAGLVSKVISVPRELSSDCGYCVRVEDGPAAQAQLDRAGVEYDRVVEQP